MAANTERVKSLARRDRLLEIEAQVRKWWEGADIFRADARETPPEPGETLFGNSPFPYMNDHLHLGHAFSISKLELATAYHRLRGANVLLPFAFHCSGMPIKASADKLAREIERYGNPPTFPSTINEQIQGLEPETEEKEKESQTILNKFKIKGKRSKVASKAGNEIFQWEIMPLYGLSDAEISKLKDPSRWLKYFPPLAIKHLKAFGLDLDRASGEGVCPLDYTLTKMEVIPPFPAKLKHLEGTKMFLAAATLRPETMYGQTNAWVLPDGIYGAFEINETDVFILTERAAHNLSYQKFSRIPQKTSCLAKLTGHDLIGSLLKSPLSFNKVLYVLPMLTLVTEKGSGIVTSVPSDSPDYFMALRDLKTNPSLRDKFGVKKEWVSPIDVIPIINVPNLEIGLQRKSARN
ncbi:hypothetical protein POUND7_009473 [Theobroma cacao]